MRDQRLDCCDSLSGEVGDDAAHFAFLFARS